MTREFYQSDEHLLDSGDRTEIQNVSRIAQEVISDWLLKIVKIESSERVLTEFNQIFLEGATECNPKIYEALRAIVAHECEEDFVNTIKRCCYILLNNWHRDEGATKNLIRCLNSVKKEPTGLTLQDGDILKDWMLNFLTSSAYREIEIFASPKAHPQDTNPPPI